MNNIVFEVPTSTLYSSTEQNHTFLPYNKHFGSSFTAIQSNTLLLKREGNIYLTKSVQVIRKVHHNNFKMGDNDEHSSPQKRNDFQPPNFPLSPEFTPPPRVPTPLPGIVPERAPLFEPESQHGGYDDDEEDEDEEEDLGKLPPWYFVLAIFAVILSIVSAYYTWLLTGLDPRFYSNPNKTTFEIESQVNSKVFGQPEAVSKMLNILQQMTEEKQENGWCKVLLLTGGPGVGKDYLTQLVKNHFHTLWDDECKDDSYISLTTKGLNCKRRDINLISFETLFSKDINKVEEAKLTLETLVRDCIEHNDKTAFILPVLAVKAHSIPGSQLNGVDSFPSSVEYWESVQREGKYVKKIFDDAGIQTELVLFRPLRWVDVKRCIQESAERQNQRQLPAHKVEDVLTQLLGSSSNTQDFVPVGCKDVDSFVGIISTKF